MAQDPKLLLEMLQNRNQPVAEQPQAQASEDKWSRVIAAAADVWGKGGGMFSKLHQQKVNNEFKREELYQKRVDRALKKQENKERKELAVQTKRYMQSLAIGKEDRARADKDMNKLSDLFSRMKGHVRGAGKLGKAWQDSDSVDKLNVQIQKFEDGSLTFDDVSNSEFSNAFSGIIAGRSPGIELIRDTKYSSMGGTLRGVFQYVTGKPQDALSIEMMRELKTMVGVLNKSTKHKLSKEVRGLWNANRQRINRNKKIKSDMQGEASKWVDINEEGIATERAFDDPFIGINPSRNQEKPLTPLQQDVLSPENIKVQHPDGRTGTIPRSQLDEAIASGYMEIK